MATPTLADYSHLPAIYGGQPVLPKPCRFIQPSLPDLESVVRQYRTSYVEGIITNSALVERLERAVAERLGVAHCVAVSSCTSGLILVLRALDLKGEVILPSFTFFATGHAVRWNNLRPVLADCEPDTWNIDPRDVARKISPRTAAILAVHLYGNPCAIQELSALADLHNVKLIFDAAHAFGSSWRGASVGSHGDAEVFSLSPTKTLVSGEGGLITTNDSTLDRRLRALRNYGDDGSYDCQILGLNARMSEFHAALGIAGLEGVDAKVRRHNQIAALYTAGLTSIPGTAFQTVREGNVSTYKDYSVQITGPQFGSTRDELVEGLAAENIPTKKYFSPPLHGQVLYRGFARRAKRGSLVVSDTISKGVVSLPIYADFPDETVARVVAAIQRLSDYHRRAS